MTKKEITARRLLVKAFIALVEESGRAPLEGIRELAMTYTKSRAVREEIDRLPDEILVRLVEPLGWEPTEEDQKELVRRACNLIGHAVADLQEAGKRVTYETIAKVALRGVKNEALRAEIERQLLIR